ncbi:MAG: pantetheine-phosphate adenylyltransferase [Faecalimonas sp.]|nr:pantetheine-phosphate adenylyltransferase [Faecalimonas sp.]
MLKAIYPGSFDPLTYGHLDVIRRSAALVDELIIGVLQNKAKIPLFSVEERVRMVQEVTKDLENVKVVPFEGLLVAFAKEMDARLVIRGLRAVTDFEYELQMAQTNHKLDDTIETLFMTTSLEYAYLSSSTVREISAFGGDVSKFVPEPVLREIVKKRKEEYKKENEDE